MLVINFLLWLSIFCLISGFKFRSLNLKNHVPLSLNTRLHNNINDDDSLPEDQYPEDKFYTTPMNEEDEALIESMREERMLGNDRWQSSSYRDSHCGIWAGNYEVYQPKAFLGENNLEMEMIGGGAMKTTSSAGEFKQFGCDITVNEEVDVLTGSDPRDIIHPKCLNPARNFISSEEWRLCRGNQIVGTAYTTCSTNDPEFVKHFRDDAYYGDICPDYYITEVAVREGPARTRVRYVYTKEATNAITSQEKEMGFFKLHLAGYLIIRELQEKGAGAAGEGVRGTGGAATSKAVESTSRSDLNAQEYETRGYRELLTSSQEGLGIYDPQVKGDPYVQINYRGRLSLMFPRAMIPQELSRNVLTMEWTAHNLRYQVDRKFGEFTQSIKSLELTEIRVEDTEKFPPAFYPLE